MSRRIKRLRGAAEETAVLLLSVFYAITSAGLYQLWVTHRITHRPPPPRA